MPQTSLPSRNVGAYPPRLTVVEFISNPSVGTNDSLTDFGFSAANVAESIVAYVEPHENSIWLRMDGGNPEATVGHEVTAGQLREVWYQMSSLTMTGDGKVSITLLRGGV